MKVTKLSARAAMDSAGLDNEPLVVLLHLPISVGGLGLALDAIVRFAILPFHPTFTLSALVAAPVLAVLMCVPFLSVFALPFVVMATFVTLRMPSEARIQRRAWAAIAFGTLSAAACILATWIPGYLDLP